jgi:hypothetical protein
VFGFCHTLASNILFSVWPICHRVIVVANFCQSLASYFFTTPFMAATLLWLATLWFGKMWPGTKQALKLQREADEEEDWKLARLEGRRKRGS